MTKRELIAILLKDESTMDLEVWVGLANKGIMYADTWNVVEDDNKLIIGHSYDKERIN